MSPNPDLAGNPNRKRKLVGSKSGVWSIPVAVRQPKEQAKPSQAPAAEHRAFVRYLCQATAVVDGCWSAKVEDVSRDGLRLLLDRRFEAGTLLRVEVELGKETLLPLLARVIYLVNRPDGTWVVGCSLAKELTEDELQVLLA
jgi:hypothetical protein